jgi:glycosyltransferase involved in cell wall biosynthesis
MNRMAMVCGDGLPVSGLLTIFRNVIDLARDMNVAGGTIPADLGFSWRPDKPAFYPSGPAAGGYPDWLKVSDALPAGDPDVLAAEWLSLRSLVARAEELDESGRADLHDRIEVHAAPYETYFYDWLRRDGIDWMFGINMTLSDAVPVTLGMHRAAARHWRDGRPGGLIFWDHDLFASYSVHEGTERVYPLRPNEFTPLPGTDRCHRWIVPTRQLADEAATYPTALAPLVVPYVLPAVPVGELPERHHQFLSQRELDPRRPVILAPVRVFHVKGVEIAVSLFAALRRTCERRGELVPYLLVFGTLDEDPEYTTEVLATVDQERVGDDLRFLGGVPVTSYQDPAGTWMLDEIDLLHIARSTDGGVFYTPNQPDVESVGLGPALAAVAGLPFAATTYDAFDGAYGRRLAHVRVNGPDDVVRAAGQFSEWLAGKRRGDRAVQDALAANASEIQRHFPDGPTRDFLLTL